ncbi:MAG: TrmH family RNA methyltransferase [Patescibacteria group bacterium]
MLDLRKNQVLLEGFHASKHAIRFGACIVELVSPNLKDLKKMTDSYAPDIEAYLNSKVRKISEEGFSAYSDIDIRTPLAGIAKRKEYTIEDIDKNKNIILLDSPRDLENIGAVVRVAAGLDLAALCTTGEHDPWHKNCIRASQGMHFALPVIHLSDQDSELMSGRELWVFDESGDDLRDLDIPNDAILLFGSERNGVSKEWLNRADRVVRIPQIGLMSSYNLATAVAMGAYHARFCSYKAGDIAREAKLHS